jgi:hypothetical protein
VIFNRHAGEEVPQPGYFMEDAHDWIKGPLSQQRAPADAWAFAWRCALLSPINEGGWPTRHALLGRPDQVADALRVLSERAGASPAGFDAMCMINLAIVAGEHDRATTLVAALHREGGFFYDVGVRHARQMALRVMQARPNDAPVKALVNDLSEHHCGLAQPPAPATPAKPGRRRR